MRHMLSTLVGKTVLRLAKLRGGGSALPGLVVDKLDSNYLARILTRLPGGVVVVSGTNGKTSTTKMIVEMLEAQGLTVFSNKTGSNFSRGVIAAAVAEANTAGHLAADIAVLELDEAHAMHFINRVKPDYTVLLNVLRDQLDRFGELDTTARFLERIADATTGSLKCWSNAIFRESSALRLFSSRCWQARSHLIRNRMSAASCAAFVWLRIFWFSCSSVSWFRAGVSFSLSVKKSKALLTDNSTSRSWARESSGRIPDSLTYSIASAILVAADFRVLMMPTMALRQQLCRDLPWRWLMVTRSSAH